MPLGPEGAVQVADTVFDAVEITEMFEESRFVTNTLVPSRVAAIPTGLLPTATVATTVLVAVLITDTLLDC